MTTVNEEYEEQPSIEDVLDGLFSNFCMSMSIEGEASIKDIFFNGVLAAIVVMSGEDLEQTIAEIDTVLNSKNESGEIDTSYLLDTDDEDDESFDDDEDNFNVVQETDSNTFEEN